VASRQVKARFEPPDREIVYCPFCGAKTVGVWTTPHQVEVQHTGCDHLMGNDRALFSFYCDDGWRPRWPDPEADPRFL